MTDATDKKVLTASQRIAIRLGAMEATEATAYQHAMVRRGHEAARDTLRRAKLQEDLEALRAEADELEVM